MGVSANLNEDDVDLQEGYRGYKIEKNALDGCPGRALRRKGAFRGERPWGDTVCDPWISDREIVSKFRG
ncbi:hypothetical protein V6Z11_D08G037400 [Gossypium hirsutum]